MVDGSAIEGNRGIPPTNTGQAPAAEPNPYPSGPRSTQRNPFGHENPQRPVSREKDTFMARAPQDPYQIVERLQPPESDINKARELMRTALKDIRESVQKAGLTLTPEQEHQLLKEVQEELSNVKPAASTHPQSSSAASQTPMSGESQEQMAIRQLFKEYLTPAGGRKPHQHIAELLVDNRNRAVFASEWASAIQSAKDIKNLEDILRLGFDPHQVQILKIKLRAELKDVNPNAKDEFQDKKNYDYESWLPSQLLPEYDAVRRALAEKLQQDQTLSSFGRNSASALIPERLLSLPEDQFIKALLIPHQPQRP